MKKTSRSILLVAIMAVILFALTGCGNKKLVATKSTDESGIKYEETIEISFKDDKANEIVWTLEFEDADMAKTFAGFLDTDEIEGLKVEQKDKKVVMTMDSEAFAEMEGDDEDLSRDAIKKDLEDDGYTVK